MSSNGSFTIQGQQNNLQTGPLNIGPFVVQCSPASYVQPIPLIAATNTFTLPASPQFFGAFILTPQDLSAGHTSIEWTLDGGATHINPTFGIGLIVFDPNNYPASIIVTTVGNATTASALQLF